MKGMHLDHIHWVVKDMDKAVAAFEKMFDTKFDAQIDVPEWGAISRIAQVGPMVGIELVQPTEPGSLFAKFLEKKGEGIQALSFKVPSLEEAKADLLATGMRLVNTLEIGDVKEAQFHPQDTFGILIELCEYQPKHSVSRACFCQ
jgi:methylmalonyl-CoA/ethylmalonyl-CoA epimerase